MSRDFVYFWYMKVFFDHIHGFGKVSDLEVIVNRAYGILESNESCIDALKEGWIPWEDKWYNERSTRLDLSIYKPSKTTKKLSKKVNVITGDVIANKETYEELYEKYCKYHGFKRDIRLESFHDCQVIEYWVDKLVGISLYKQFETQFVAYQFIWDYENPKLSLGTVAQYYECETAKILGCEYVYLLGGYEMCCKYKADYIGFEFWTGNKWSKDVELYKELVTRDEKIKIIGYDV
jgi:arginyl-tRNA--protein-N-Asp/Glu arginylyltransferase